MPKKSKRSRLLKLQNSWEKSSAQERTGFMRWLEASGVSAMEAPTAPMSEVPIASGRYLTPAAIARIKSIMLAPSLSVEVMVIELGFASDDVSLGRALEDNVSLRLAMVAALEKLLIVNATVWLRSLTSRAHFGPAKCSPSRA
jgi:hypothetical protein